jgi:hypothetical protein
MQVVRNSSVNVDTFCHSALSDFVPNLFTLADPTVQKEYSPANAAPEAVQASTYPGPNGAAKEKSDWASTYVQ